jgi:tetratricopeptide (TPR) repeat protein
MKCNIHGYFYRLSSFMDMNRLTFCLLLFTTAQTFGQHKNLVNKTYPQRYEATCALYLRLIPNPDSLSAFREADEIKALALSHADKDLELEIDLLKAYYLTVWHTRDVVVIQKKLDKLIENALIAKNLQIYVRAKKVLGDYYWDGLKNYELAFETYIVLEQALRKVGGKDLPDKVFHLQNMANAYHHFSDYRKALQLYSQIINLEVDNDPRGGYNSALYSIGKIHRQLGNLDSSDYYYNRIINNASSVNYRIWKGIAQGGLGHNCYLRGKFERATPLLQADVDLALQEKDYGLAAGSLTTLADIFLKKNELDKAESYALHARKCLSLADPDRYKYFQDLYPILGKIYAAKGVIRRVGPYLDSAIFAKDSITRQFNAMQMMRARQKMELQEHRAAIEIVDSEKRLKILERNILLITVLLVLIGSVYSFYNLRKRHRQQEQQQAREIELKKEQLADATRQLNEFAKNISEKSSLIAQLEMRQDAGADAGILSQLRENTILTQDEWESFKKLFEKVHAGYLFRLKRKFPDLTQSEIRFIALIKLGLSYREMSSILGVSDHAVRTTKYRLLKKIDVPENQSIEDLMVNI